MTVILASTSGIRRHLLTAAGLIFTTKSPNVDEAAIKDREVLDPHSLATVLAEAKARTVSMEVGGSLIIGADQVLAIGGVVLDKPRTASEAREHLLILRGRTHILHSAVACARDGDIIWEFSDTAYMTMRAFSDPMLDRYMAEAGDNILSSVGAYKIEGTGVQFFDKIDGSYFTILGLPLLPLLDFLRQQGELSI